MTPRKSLGQIAYEAYYTHDPHAYWDNVDRTHKEWYERMAAAVARAVKRRGKRNKE